MDSMGRIALLSLNDIGKALESRLGFLIMYEPMNGNEWEIKIYFASCRFANTGYKDLFGVNPDQKLEESQMKVYHYDSFEEIEVDYPKAIFQNIRRHF